MQLDNSSVTECTKELSRCISSDTGSPESVYRSSCDLISTFAKSKQYLEKNYDLINDLLRDFEVTQNKSDFRLFYQSREVVHFRYVQLL